MTEITITNLAKLCIGLGIDLPTFFDFSKTTAGIKPRESADLRKALQILAGLPPEQLADAITKLHAIKPPRSRQTKRET